MVRSFLNDQKAVIDVPYTFKPLDLTPAQMEFYNTEILDKLVDVNKLYKLEEELDDYTWNQKEYTPNTLKLMLYIFVNF